ncbi:MAG: hypothetical protein JW936_02665 [Sedimentisphaerales bacterium]|nr:hypothetical protein [Sedimentisphaerales bacterium]
MGETYRRGDPYELAGKRLAFVNWSYVRPTGFGWFDQAGKNVMVVGDQKLGEAEFRRFEPAYGVEIVVREAHTTEPLIQPQHSYEAGGIQIGTILKDGGIYRMWANAGWGDLHKRGTHKGYCYYESEDGYEWKRPNLALVEYEGSKDNNLLAFGGGGAVFVDPSAEPSQRYKIVYTAEDITDDELERYVAAGGEVDPMAKRSDVDIRVGVRAAVSADGFQWQRLDRPVLVAHVDTELVGHYDSHRRKYVGYFRDWAELRQAEPYASSDEKADRCRWLASGRRAIGRSESEDFSLWPMQRIVLDTSPQMSPSEVLYTNSWTTIPGAADCELMFPAIWDTSTDTTSIGIASSSDGVMWNWLTNKRVLHTGPSGRWDGGCVFGGVNLLELPNGDFVLPITGYSVPHKYPRVHAERRPGYAVWSQGRLVGIEAAQEGGFSTKYIIAPGGKMTINAASSQAGKVLVEVVGLDGKVVPGRSFEDCVPIIGDCHGQEVRWKGHDDIGVNKGQAVMLRFKLDRACVYFVDFED